MRTLRISNAEHETLYINVLAKWDAILTQIIDEVKNICDHGFKIQMFNETDFTQAFASFNQDSDLKHVYSLVSKRRGHFEGFILHHDGHNQVNYYNNNEELISELNDCLQSCLHVESENINGMAEEELIAFAGDINIIVQTNDNDHCVTDEIVQKIRRSNK